MYKNAVNLYKKLLTIYFNAYSSIIDEKNKTEKKKYDPSNLFHKGYKYDRWYRKLDEKKSKVLDSISFVISSNTINIFPFFA